MNKDSDGFDDMKLTSPGQEIVRSIVKSLPEEPLSMAWRSSLNEQLLLIAAKQKRRKRLLWVASPIAGFSFAMALAFVVMFNPSRSIRNTSSVPGIESAIISDHHSSSITNEVSAAGLNLNEVNSDANQFDPQDGIWNESDVESL